MFRLRLTIKAGRRTGQNVVQHRFQQNDINILPQVNESVKQALPFVDKVGLNEKDQNDDAN